MKKTGLVGLSDIRASGGEMKVTKRTERIHPFTI